MVALDIIPTGFMEARIGRPRKRQTPLSRWLDKSRFSRDEFAAKLGITRTSLDRLCRADRRPSLALALRIEEETSGAVTVRDWQSVEAHAGD